MAIQKVCYSENRFFDPFPPLSFTKKWQTLTVKTNAKTSFVFTHRVITYGQNFLIKRKMSDNSWVTYLYEFWVQKMWYLAILIRLCKRKWDVTFCLTLSPHVILVKFLASPPPPGEWHTFYMTSKKVFSASVYFLWQNNHLCLVWYWAAGLPCIYHSFLCSRYLTFYTCCRTMSSWKMWRWKRTMCKNEQKMGMWM